MDDKENKKFVKPEAEIISFTDDDIITVSIAEDPGFEDGELW